VVHREARARTDRPILQIMVFDVGWLDVFRDVTTSYAETRRDDDFEEGGRNDRTVSTDHHIYPTLC
jgi:hypothetical protein